MEREREVRESEGKRGKERNGEIREKELEREIDWYQQT